MLWSFSNFQLTPCCQSVAVMLAKAGVSAVGAAIMKSSAIKCKLKNQIDKTCDKTVTQAGNMSNYLKLGRKLQELWQKTRNMNSGHRLPSQGMPSSDKQVLLGVY
ncbi:hypothetical protein ACFE04_020448 [Oxalis oulophora]